MAAGRERLRLVSDADRLPPLVPSEMEETGDSAAAPPEWLSRAVPIALPSTIANPFREHQSPLFEPKWQRAIVTRLGSIKMPVGELDLACVVEHIARARPLAEVPRRALVTAAKGVRLLVDQASSMEPYRLDVTELVRSFRRILGAARVSTQTFRGLPAWGITTGIDFSEYHAPPPGVPLVIVSDLGLPPCDPHAIRAAAPEWRKLFQRSQRTGHACTVVVPRDAGELPAIIRRDARVVPWGRRTLASRLDAPLAGRGGHSSHNSAEAHADNVVTLDILGNLSSGALELALLGSLAVRIEPHLLRALRLALAPHLSVSVEADLWFSNLVADRAPTGIVLDPFNRETLQRLLRRDRSRFDDAYALIETLHRDAPPMLRAEEELAYRWLVGDVDRSRELIRNVVATLIAPARTGVSKWAAQALVRLPRALMSLEETQMLALGTALRTGASGELQTIGGGGSSWHWLRPAARELELGVNLRRGMIEFGPRSMHAAHRIRVPDTIPVTLEVVLAHTRAVRRVRLDPLAHTVIEVEGDAFEIDVLGGGRWKLRSATPARSAQRPIARSRAPRVHLTYDIELYGAEKKIQLPFVLGVLADLQGTRSTDSVAVAERRFREIDVDNFNDRMRAIEPRLSLEVLNTLSDEESMLRLELVFRNLDDFGPGAVALQVPALRELLQRRNDLLDLQSQADGSTTAGELLHTLLVDSDLQRSLAGHPTGSDPFASSSDARVEEFVRKLEAAIEPRFEGARPRWLSATQALASGLLARPDVDASDALGAIAQLIAEIDRKLSAQVERLLHHESFQRLEGTWRGLYYLVSNTETDEMLKIRVLDISKRELARTLQRFSGEQWDHSPIFKQIYEREYGTFGGEPYACLVGDYQFDHNPADVQTLAHMARIAASAHCPFVSGASPRLLLMDSWQELSNPRDATKIFSTPEYAPWRALRESEDARYLALAMPRFLARLPYGSATTQVEAFAFEETTDSTEDTYTWANSAYAMAANVARAFKLYGWCARIRGVESGGRVEGLPVHVFPADDGGVAMKSPTEIAITDRREAELARSGLLPLVHFRNTDYGAFISAQSLQQPPTYEDPQAAANAVLAARLPYLFACTRFVHYVNCITRDKLGSFQDRESLQRYLQSWLAQYVDPDPATSSEAAKAQRPLAAAEITLGEQENDTSRYVATLYLRPHYQLEGLTVSLRLATVLPGIGAPYAPR